MEEPGKKIRYKKVRNLHRTHSRKSIKSDNLHVPLTPSTFRKIKSSASRPSTAKSRSCSDSAKFVGGHKPGLVRLPHAPASKVPENVAVHFASFYQNQNKALPHSAEEKEAPTPRGKSTSRNSPEMEFTRQMVYELENSAGTQHYRRQVSALLANTVEPPGFDLKLPPVDNCAPYNDSNDHYPLWYRDPNKIPQISRKQFETLKNKYRCGKTANERGEGFGEAEESISDSSESEVELETETESEEESFRCEGRAALSTGSSKSTLSTMNKNFDESIFDTNGKSIRSFSEHCGWSSQTGETEAEDEKEESEDDSKEEIIREKI